MNIRAVKGPIAVRRERRRAGPAAPNTFNEAIINN